jgi:hypothetical protein
MILVVVYLCSPVRASPCLFLNLSHEARLPLLNIRKQFAQLPRTREAVIGPRV